MKKRVVFIFFVLMTTAFALAQMDQWALTNPIAGHYLSEAEIAENTDYTRDFTPTDPPAGEVRQTAEFEPMEGCLIVWPLGVPYELIAEISQDAIVYTVVSSGNQSSCASSFQSHNVNMDNVVYINASTNTYWVRDFGPWFIMEDNSQISIVDFPYNRPRPLDDETPVVVANFLGTALYGMDIEQTGGNYMCDGYGNGASTDLVWEENTNLSHDEINQRMEDFLGITNYHVTLDPLGDYIKHIDCWGKFLDVDKVLIGQVPTTDPRYDDYESVADYFASQTSGYGTPYQVFRVFSPGDYWNATPYTNSLILNDKVFVPQTGNQYDDEALDVYETAMPGYEIIGVYSTEWLDTDALHCRTRGVADRGMLYIKHQPVITEQPAGEDILIHAELFTLSGQPLISDSLYVNYRVDSVQWQSVAMTNLSGAEYDATIPAQTGGTVEYYIHASDQSGRTNCHPFIGAADPHSFTITSAPAELAVDPLQIDVSLTPDTTQTELVSLTNIGGLPLSFSISESPAVPWLSVSPDAGSLDSGASSELTLTFDTTAMTTGTYSCDVVITDDRRETTTVAVSLTVSGTGVHTPVVLTASAITGNYPNPFNPSTTIIYFVAQPSDVRLSVYNIKGEIVKTMVDTHAQPGTYSAVWNGTDDNGNDVASGIYFARLNSNTRHSVRKLMLMK